MNEYQTSKYIFLEVQEKYIFFEVQERIRKEK